MTTRSSYEPLLNGRLGQMLKASGLDVKIEEKQPGATKQIDVEVTLGEIVVAVEGERSRRRAIVDAQERLDQADLGLVVVHEAVGVCYPPGLRTDSFDENTVVEWVVLPDTTFVKGTVTSLAATIRQIPAGRGDPDRIAKRLERALKRAANWLSGDDKKLLARAMNLPVAQTVNRKRIDRTEAATVRALLVIVAAAMFHAKLDRTLPPAPTRDARTGGDFNYPWPPMRLSACRRQDNIADALDDAWSTILALDYRPVFEAGRRAVATPADSENWRKCLRLVTSEAQDAAASAAAAGHDLLGRIFHRLLDTARYDGSYYTGASSAVLLAGLAIGAADLPEDIDDFKVIDPACGTGTLLMAVAERLRELRPSGRDLEAATLIENVIWGLDVNVTACHMAATTLGLLSPSTAFTKMNIHLMRFGKVGRVQASRRRASRPDVRVGSLELLDEPDAAAARQRLGGAIWSPGEHFDSQAAVGIPPNSFDLVIMNPPFTRDSLRHDQFEPAVEQAMKAREKDLMSSRHGHGSSSGTMFMDLGEHLTGLQDGATLALVLPRATAAAPSARQVREMLGQWFHIEWVVHSHDPSREHFSENTNISEMLVVARRHPDPPNAPATRFLCLRKNPATAAQAAAILEPIRNGQPASEWGAISSWPASRMAIGDWQSLCFHSPHLADIYEKFSSGALGDVRPLKEFADVGPAGQRIRDAFANEQYADQAARRALWHNDTEKHQRLLSDPDVYIHAKPPSEQQYNPAMADRYWKQRGCLFLAVSPRLNTLAIMATCTPSAVLGSGWVVIRPHGTDPTNSGPSLEDKALAVWLNSTLGVVTILGGASPKVLSRPNLSLDAMRSLPIPVLESDHMTALADVFDQHADTPLLRLQDIETDHVRRSLDDAVESVVGNRVGDLSVTRQELAAEPSIVGQ